MKTAFSAPLRLRFLMRVAAVLMAAVIVTACWWLAAGKRDVPAASQVAPLVPPAPPALITARSKLPAKVRSWLEEIEREKSPSDQAAAAARLAARLTSEDWPLLLTHLPRISSSLAREVLEAAVVRRWAEADPEAAAAWGLQHHGALAAEAAAAWVRHDTAAARAWFDSLTPRQRQEGYLLREEFYVALANVDSEACFATMLDHYREPGFGISWAEQAIVKAAPEQALAFAEQVTDKGLRESIRTAVAREFGRRDPFAAVAWAEQQPDPQTMLPAVFQQLIKPPAEMIPALASLTTEQQAHVRKSWSWWERGDPLVTLETLRHPPEGLTEESRRLLTQRALSVLTRQYDPADAAHLLTTEWADYAGMWERLVADSWTRQDPGAARAWIEQLPSGPARDQAQEKYEEEMKSKTQNENARAERMLTDLSKPLSRSSGASWLGSLNENELHSLWEQTMTLPADQQAPAQGNLIAYQADKKPAAAAEWLSQQPETPRTTELTSLLVANWALDDAPAAARWVESLPEGDPKTWALWNLARQWQRVDPAAARRWAGQQPEAVRTVAESAFADRRPAR